MIGWFEKRALPELEKLGCTILMTMRYASALRKYILSTLVRI